MSAINTGPSEPRPTRDRRRPGLGGRSERTVSRSLVLPSQLLLLFMVGFPTVVAFYIAFTEWTPTSGLQWFDAYRSWRWFGSYWEALSSPSFWHAIWRTVLVVVVAVSVEFVLGFALALLFVKKFKGRSLLTLVFLLPMMVVPAVSGFIFFMIFQTDGPVNAALTALLPGEVHIHWLDDPSVVLWSVMIADIWQWTPLMFLILLSGLVALPEDQMNAARILGAGYGYQLRTLILPMMKPIIIIALIIRSMEAFKIFDAPWFMAQGGPGEASSTISVFLYRETFLNTRWGFATAAAILVLLAVSLAAVRAIRPLEQAQEESLEELMLEERPDDDTSMHVEIARASNEMLRARTEGEEVSFEADALPVRSGTSTRSYGWARPLGRWLAVGLIGVFFVFPLYWVCTMAFKPPEEWVPIGKTYWLPQNPTLENFRSVLGLEPPGAFFSAGGTDASGPIKNSLIAASGGTLLAVIIGVFAAYGISRFRAGGRALPFQILQLRMFPPVAIIIPLMIMWDYLGLIDTIYGLILVYAAVTFAFVVWLMRSFFQEVPREVSEAAIVDGCTHWGALFRAVLPLTKAGLAVTALFVFILNWSDFLIALILSQQTVVTAPVFLNSMQSVGAGQLFGPQAALAMILIIPPALFGLAIQKYLVRGLTFGAIKR